MQKLGLILEIQLNSKSYSALKKSWFWLIFLKRRHGENMTQNMRIMQNLKIRARLFKIVDQNLKFVASKSTVANLQILIVRKTTLTWKILESLGILRILQGLEDIT